MERGIKITIIHLSAVNVVLWSIMVILKENELAELSTNPGQSCWHFTSHECPKERHESILFPRPPIRKLRGIL